MYDISVLNVASENKKEKKLFCFVGDRLGMLKKKVPALRGRHIFYLLLKACLRKHISQLQLPRFPLGAMEVLDWEW